MRYQCRGVDPCGNVANYVETEQIVIASPGGTRPGGAARHSHHEDSIVSSFVQLRGSIPLYWEQRQQKVKAKVVFAETPDQVCITSTDKHKQRTSKEHLLLVVMGQTLGFRRHFDSLVNEYGDVTVVNLIDSDDQEGALEAAFRRNVQLLHNPKVRYVHFDFHEMCKKNRFDRVSLLYQQLEDTHTEMKFAAALTKLHRQRQTSKPHVRDQTGTFCRSAEHSQC